MGEGWQSALGGAVAALVARDAGLQLAHKKVGEGGRVPGQVSCMDALRLGSLALLAWRLLLFMPQLAAAVQLAAHINPSRGGFPGL